jgi:hypothetical protein
MEGWSSRDCPSGANRRLSSTLPEIYRRLIPICVINRTDDVQVQSCRNHLAPPRSIQRGNNRPVYGLLTAGGNARAAFGHKHDTLARDRGTLNFDTRQLRSVPRPEDLPRQSFVRLLRHQCESHARGILPYVIEWHFLPVCQQQEDRWLGRSPLLAVRGAAARDVAPTQALVGREDPTAKLPRCNSGRTT